MPTVREPAVDERIRGQGCASVVRMAILRAGCRAIQHLMVTLRTSAVSRAVQRHGGLLTPRRVCSHRDSAECAHRGQTGCKSGRVRGGLELDLAGAGLGAETVEYETG